MARTSGPSNSSPFEETAPFVEPTVTETEQAQVDRTTPLSVEHIQNSLSNPQTDFVLPAELDHYTPSTDDHGKTASALPVSSGSSARLIPYASTNKLVYKHQHELNRPLEELGKIDSHCDAEVMERRKEVVQAVERGLEGGERIVGEVVEQRPSIIGPFPPVIEGPLKGFDIDEGFLPCFHEGIGSRSSRHRRCCGPRTIYSGSARTGPHLLCGRIQGGHSIIQYSDDFRRYGDHPGR